MKTGRELDALIAEKVMGLKDENGFYVTLDCPHYSTDISSAWEVVEKMKGQSAVLNYGEDTQGWECSFIVGGKRYTSVRSQITHAICLAALAAVVSNSSPSELIEHIWFQEVRFMELVEWMQSNHPGIKIPDMAKRERKLVKKK